MKRTISVIIPAYEEQAYLGPCLESLKNRYFDDFELIVVDNNSSDETVRIARDYTDIVLSCPNQGISSARNFGAAHTTGDILCFIDADGIVSEGWGKNVLSTVSGQGDIDAVSGCNVFRVAILSKAEL